MLAMTYRRPYRVRAEQVPEPVIEHPNDAIVRVTRACICRSDLHLHHGLVPDTRVGSVFGHEFTGVEGMVLDVRRRPALAVALTVGAAAVLTFALTTRPRPTLGARLRARMAMR